MSVREIEIKDIPQAIDWEELQRIEKGPYFAVTKVSAKQKIIAFETEDGERIVFERGVRQRGLDDLTIKMVKLVRTTVKCSLGHEHYTGVIEHEYHRAHLEWSHVEALIEWVQSGSWSQVRERKGKA